MFHEGNGLREKTGEALTSSRSLGEALGLEDQYLDMLDKDWKLETYYDENHIEHLRCFHVPSEIQEDREYWEIVPRDGEASALELLVDLPYENSEKG